MVAAVPLVKVCGPASVIARLNVGVPPVAFIPFANRIGLPPKVYAPPWTVIVLKVERNPMLQFVAYCAAVAGNTRSSPAAGATSVVQFAAVAQFPSAPPPSQVRTAAAADPQSNIKSITVLNTIVITARR
jgi:hypothetical protein